MITFPRAEVHGTIGDRFRRVADEIPDHLAVKTPKESRTYGELNRASEDIARGIIDRRGQAEEPVALILEPGIPCVTGMLGVVKAGKSIVVLPPDMDPGRMRAVWSDAGKPPIIAGGPFLPLAAELTHNTSPYFDMADLSGGSVEPVSIRHGPDSTAGILYTSGTTGEPRGVICSHEFLLHFAWHNHDEFGTSDRDRLGLVSSQGFSAGLAHIFSTLTSGAELHLPLNPNRQMRSLVEFLKRERITILVMTTPALLRKLWTGLAERVSLPHLRDVVIGGEQLRREDVEWFRNFLPEKAVITHRLASSEVMIVSLIRIAHDTPLPWQKIPVGRVIADKELLLLDENHRPVAAGKTGEIAIRSRYLADGYFGQPEQTREKFLPDPEGGDRRIFLSGDVGRLLPNGMLDLQGRKDNQVRVRGFNVQLETVRQALMSLPGVKDAAAAAPVFPDGNTRLVAYIVPHGEARPDTNELHKGLVAALPPHMIPTVFHFLDSLPRTTSNRVDRSALPLPAALRPELKTPFTPPRDETERRLCSLWAGIIGIDRAGIDDDFFLLGGDSLLAIHMVLRVEEILNRRIPTAFYSNPTIRNLVELWAGKNTAQSESSAAGPSAGEEAMLPEADRKRKHPKKARKYRKRYRQQTTVLGPYSIRRIKRIPRLAAELATLRLTYPQGCRWLSRWCRQPFVLRHFYPAESALFSRWLGHLGIGSDVSADALSAAVLSNILWSRRFKGTITLSGQESLLPSLKVSSAVFFRDLARIIESAPFDRLGVFFAVEGLPHLQTAVDTGRGVILVSYHGSVSRFVPSVFPRFLAGEPVRTLALTRALHLARGQGIFQQSRKAESALLANLAQEGHQWLQQGKIVQVIPDLGYDATNGVPLVIGKNRFLIKPGFSELAILSGAAIVPYLATRRIDGRIDIRFFPAFEDPPRSVEHTVRVDHLMHQYAEFVFSAWKTAPESLLWQVIDTHMNRPADDGKP